MHSTIVAAASHAPGSARDHPPPPPDDTIVFENPLRERETKIAPGTVLTPVLEAIETVAQSAKEAAAPVVQFVASIPSYFDSDPAPAPAPVSTAAPTDHAAKEPPANQPFTFGHARNFGFVVPDMYLALPPRRVPSPPRPFTPTPLHPHAPSPPRPFTPTPLHPHAPSPPRPFTLTPLQVPQAARPHPPTSHAQEYNRRCS
jgi:hypothetical protein